MGQYKHFKEIRTWTIVNNSTVYKHIFTETSYLELPGVFRIIVLVSNQIEYWSNYSIQNFKYSHRTGLCSVLCPRQHSIGHMGDGFYRSKDPTNSIKLLKEILQRTNQTTKTTKYTYAHKH